MFGDIFNCSEKCDKNSDYFFLKLILILKLDEKVAVEFQNLDVGLHILKQ